MINLLICNFYIYQIKLIFFNLSTFKNLYKILKSMKLVNFGISDNSLNFNLFSFCNLVINMNYLRKV